MSISRIRMFALATLGALTSFGVMQGAEQATFHLPVEAHWGLAVLQPGDYRLSLPDNSIGLRTLNVAGDNRTISAMPLVTDVQESSNSSKLELLQVNGSYFVREFSYGPAGKTFIFFVPKPTHRQQVAKLRTVNASITSN